MYFEQSYFLSLKPFPAAGLFLYPLKTLEKQTFSDVFRGYRKWPVAMTCLRRCRINVNLQDIFISINKCGDATALLRCTLKSKNVIPSFAYIGKYADACRWVCYY